MESKLYFVINGNQHLGQNLSKRLAQIGNTVVYLGNEEQRGYSLAADEPRVRFRYCDTIDTSEIITEYQWAEKYVSAVDGIVILVPLDNLFLLENDYCDALLAAREKYTATFESPVTLTYVIFPTSKQEARSLPSLHLKLARRQNGPASQTPNVRVNHVVIASPLKFEELLPNELIGDASELIHYLTSTKATSLNRQALFLESTSA